MPATQESFDGLAFPTITVRLGNGSGTATMRRYSDQLIRKRTSYTYDQRDGAAFAVKCARAAWDEYVKRSQAESDYTPEEVILIPGDLPAGYVFTAVPVRFFA